ncbi:DNA cytosine methyltransferase [Pseudoxanthomonas sp. UTMC 1351]|uniref:DNA cytosine methyltransferase n=1 Tax=Pseudoxanthomonas sp. UTMC 1351 TaxID=2695853 RepID=UPI0034CDFC0A
MAFELVTDHPSGDHEIAPAKPPATGHRTKDQLTTVELFCGIGGFRHAADKVGLKTVWANDFSSAACSVYRQKYGNDVLHEGDVKGALDLIPPHDILTGGFPCQPFSAAGKKAGIRDPRGTLFQTIVDVVRQRRPKHFVLENVKRLLSMEHGVHFETVLSALSTLDYFIEWRVLNAKDFGLAQNRERVVIVGTRLDGPAVGFSPSEALRLATPQELPHGLNSMLNQLSGWTSFHKHKARFPLWGVALNGRYLSADPIAFAAALPQVSLLDVLDRKVPVEYDYTESTLERLHMNEIVDRFVNGVEIISNQSGGARMGYTIFGVRGLAPTLTASTSRHYERYQVGKRYRRLTPQEYARLQGFSDNHCSAVKPYDQYALYGNAVPPPMVEWVLRQLVGKRKPLVVKASGQREMIGV